jgi:hypothetical protein
MWYLKALGILGHSLQRGMYEKIFILHVSCRAMPRKSANGLLGCLEVQFKDHFMGSQAFLETLLHSRLVTTTHILYLAMLLH